MIDILGIDCATDPRNTGIAHATLDVMPDAGLETPPPLLRYLASGSPAAPTAETLASLLTPGRPAVVGLDAPLGWPAAMGRVLAGHRAGEAVGIAANELFRRHTDRVVRDRIGKQPLDVGADRIARTAVAALDLLAELRRLTGRALPVATRGAHIPRPGADTVPDAAVEVYRAGRLMALRGEGYRRGYRASGEAAQTIRRGMLRDLEAEISYGVDAEPAVADVDLLDATICVCAVVDVLRGRCAPPEELGLPLDDIDGEGWIWLPLSDGVRP